MKAIILAAGRGSRMGGLTETTPKPLVKIDKKPLMEYVIRTLAANGVKEIGINVFYLGDKIINHFGDGEKFGVKIDYVREKNLSGTAGGVKVVAKVIKPKEPFFVIPGDWLGNFDLASFYKFHLKTKDIVSLCCSYRPRDPIKDCGIILFDKNTKQIQQYVDKPQPIIN